jgi:threonine dehydrogenase-like Zn-dependent dehydrogenase
VGEDVSAVAPGETVAFRRPHASRHVVPATDVVSVPDGVPTIEAVWFALAQIAFRGSYAAESRSGDQVLIIGAGPIGQMAVRWAAFAGAFPLIVVDPFASRLEHARRGGATHVVVGTLAESVDEIRAANGGMAPGKIIDTTGNAAVFGTMLRLAPPYGRLLLLSFSAVAHARFDLSGLTTHHFSAEQAQEAYDFAARDRGGAMGIVFDW